MLGISRRTLINWEAGEMPNLTHRRKILELIQNVLGLVITENLLLESDISLAVGPLSVFTANAPGTPKSDTDNEANLKKRKMWDLMLKLETLDDDTLIKVIDFVETQRRAIKN
jgi:transcriptional regulator with XRE-family HTH domain